MKNKMNSVYLPKFENPITQWRTHLVFIPILLISFVACYHDVLAWMYNRYISPESYYSHGFMIPFVSGYFIWQKREKLSKESAEKSWWGFSLIILSVLVHIAGTVLYVYSVSGFSIFLFIFGVTLFLFGKNITRLILFPLIYLILMFPPPMAFIEAISFPMKMFVAKSGVEFVRLLGIPIVREGFHIHIPAGSLLVGNPCSGLRSLIAFVAVGTLFSYLSNLSIIKKFLLSFLSIPVAILSNVIRTSILILISNFWGLSAAAPDSFWHSASGILVFIFGVAGLFYIGRFLEWGT